MSKKIVYREFLASKRRELLIDMCIELKRQSKKFLYILPSREAIQYVRSSMHRRGGGIRGSKVIMFDELERDIAYGSAVGDKVSAPAVDKIVLDTLCMDVKEELLYFKGIAHKEGFTDELYKFIRDCKRQYIAPKDLLAIIDAVEDNIFKAKLKDIYTVYSAYEGELQKRDIYSMDDIAIEGLHSVSKSPYLNNIDSIVVDGFINIDPIDMNILREIAHRGDVHLYINVPYMNPLISQFVDRELVEPLVDMGFYLDSDEKPINSSQSSIARLVNNLYTGEQVDVDVNSISIKRYPCARSEIRETARDIKQKLKRGESPHNIAIYINDEKEYSKHIWYVFKEFNIPIKLDYNLPISTSILSREIIAIIRETELEHMHWAQWLDVIDDYLSHKKETFYQEFEETDTYNMINIEVWKSIDDQLRLINSSLDNRYIPDNLVTRESFLNYLIKWISTATVQIEYGDESGVRILSTDLARGQYYSHIYILGMNDGIMPALPSHIGMLSRQERDMLMDMGINYKNRDWELQREKIRLCLALATADNSVVLSYRETGRGDEMLMPSPFIDEIKLVSGLEEEIATMRERFEIDTSGMISDREMRYMSLKGRCEELWSDPTNADISIDCQRMGVSIAESYIQRHRQRGKYFNNYEGIVDPTLLPLGEDFYISATDIDQYYFCPYSFFMGKIMGGRTFEQSPKEYDNMDIGSFYHAMLREYYMYLDQFESLDEKRLKSIYNRVLDTEIRDLDLPEVELEKIKGEFFDPLYEITGVFISKDLKRLEKYKSATGRELRPIILERGFRDSNIFGMDMRCRVDRVDMEYENIDGEWMPTGKFVVYDYKKSRSNGLDHILKHNVCQLGIYYFLIRDAFEKIGYSHPDCMALLYYGIEENGEDDGKAIKYDGIYRSEYKKELGLGRKHYAMDEEVFHAFLGYIKDLTLYAIGRIKNGKFHYAPNCPVYTEHFVRYTCEYREICRYNRHKIRTIIKGGGEICYGQPFRGI